MKEKNLFYDIDHATARVTMCNYFSPVKGRAYWGPRILTDWEFIFQVGGRSEYKTRTCAVTIGQGQLLIIPPTANHVYTCELESRPTISCIHFSYLGDTSPIQSVRVIDCANDPEIERLFFKCAREHEQRAERWQQIRDSAFSEILFRLSRLREKKISKAEKTLARALRYINEHFTEAINRQTVADHVGITPEHLNLIFKKHARITPVSYLTNLRIQHAKKRMLCMGATVKETARAVGYEDPYYFARVFKKKEGLPPGRWARKL